MNDAGKKIIVAVTGASGHIYARLLLQLLARSGQVAEIALIVSRMGVKVGEYEKVELPHAAAAGGMRIVRYDNDDFFAPPASGSARYDAMVVIPCSMGCIGRIAAGVSSDLIGRSADVMLKERRRLVVVPRETPFSAIHLQNLATLAGSGAIIAPASPSFYSFPGSIEELCMTVVERVAALSGVDVQGYEWGAGR